MEKLNNKQVHEMLISISLRFQELRDELCELDSKIGDGDHGISMDRGAKAANITMNNMVEPYTISDLFREYGWSLIRSVGGAIGPIFGLLFTEMGKSTKGNEFLTTESLVIGLRGSCNKIMEFGGARPGDKTLVDGMIYTLNNYEENHSTKLPLSESLPLLTKFALDGAKTTIEMTAKRGRARFLQERSKGYQDAGATSFYYLLDTMSRFVKGE